MNAEKGTRKIVNGLDKFSRKNVHSGNLGGLTDIVNDGIDYHRDILENIQQDESGGYEVPSKDCFLFYALLVKEAITGVLLPLFDIGSDIVTCVTHALWGNYGWAIATLVFIFLPGIVAALAIAIQAIKREFIGCKTALKLFGLILAFPLVYPVAQILVNSYMVYLLFLHQSRNVVKILGHDVKQFKSLEGFLESGPQFVLQSYILFRGDLRGLEDIDTVDDLRVATISVSVILSFISLVKTGLNVNVPDPDEERTSPQYPENVGKLKFFVTALIFYMTTVIFRVMSLSLMLSVLKLWTLIFVFVTIAVSSILFMVQGTSKSISILLGFVNTFMPNGYLLYNFAGTVKVDLSFEGIKSFLIYHMGITTVTFITGLISILILGKARIVQVLPENSFLIGVPYAAVAMNAGLIVLGLLSCLACYIHWKNSIEPLHDASASPSGEVEAQDELCIDEDITDVL